MLITSGLPGNECPFASINILINWKIKPIKMMTKRTLLLVDDEPNILKALKRLLRRDGYTINVASGGTEALQFLQNNPVGVIVSDHRMPVMTGIEFLAKVKEHHPDITRIVLSGYSDLDTVTEAINQGNIYKFIAKPWDDTELRTTIQEAFEHFELRMENNRLTEELQTANKMLMQKNAETSSLVEQIVNHNTDGIVVVDTNNKVIFSNPSALTLLIESYRALPGDEFRLPFKENQVFHHSMSRPDKPDLQLEIRSSTITHEGEHASLVTIHDISDIERIQSERQRSENSIKKTMMQMIDVISLIIEKRDPYSAEHQKRVTELAVAIAKAMNLDDTMVEGISIGAQIHDIGKIHIPAEILNRAGSLNKYERLIVQQHTNTGFEIMSKIDFPWPVAKMILQHHEHVDGTGYPNGITGNDMIIESKILALVDVVSAMSEYRRYRSAHPLDNIVEYIKQESGKKFDPAVVDYCTQVLNENKSINSLTGV